MAEEEEAIRAAAEELSLQFKTLINIQEVGSIKQIQHLISADMLIRMMPTTWAHQVTQFRNIYLTSSSLVNAPAGLGRLQDSNAVLSHFNEYSERCFTDISGDFTRNARLLKSIKADLDYIFMKLRSMKSRLKAMYPDAFPDASTISVLDQRPDLEKPLS